MCWSALSPVTLPPSFPPAPPPTLPPGELAELKADLQSDKKEKKKEAVKKIIASMTVGKDVRSAAPLCHRLSWVRLQGLNGHCYRVMPTFHPIVLDPDKSLSL